MARSRTGSAIRAAASVADLDPLTPATFSADEPDADGNGIPDLWEGSDAIQFDGCDSDGFPWDISLWIFDGEQSIRRLTPGRKNGSI